MSLARRFSRARHGHLRNALAVAIAVQSLVIAFGPVSDDAEAAPAPLNWSDPIDIKAGTWPWMYPVIARDGEDMWVAWVANANGGDVVARHRTGTVWGDPFTVHSAQASMQTMPWVAAGSGVVHAVWVDEREGDSDIYYRHSGESRWSKELELSSDTASNEPQLWPNIAVDGDEVHAVWADGKTGTYEIFYRHFDGAAWGDEAILSDETLPEPKFRPTIAAEAGVVHVAWEYNSADKVIQYKRFSQGAWGTTETIFDSAGKDGSTPRLRVDGGVPYIIYSVDDGTKERVFLRHKSGLMRWSSPEDVGWAGVPGDHASPSFDVEAGHIYLMYINKDGLDWFAYFRHYDGTEWADAIRMDVRSPILYDTSPYIEAHEGVVHAAWYYLRDEFYSEVEYAEALADIGRPTSAPTGLSPYWMDGAKATLKWQAHDDYGLRALHVMYSYSADLVDWTTLANLVDVPLSGKDAAGETVVTAVDREGFYRFQTRAEDLGGHVELPFLPATLRCAYDSSKPHGALAIDKGDEWTGSSTVSLNVTFSDRMTELNWTAGPPVPFKARFSNDGVWDDEQWAPYTGNVTWDLVPGEGNRTVHFQVMDHAGLVSPDPARNITVDLTPPVGVIAIEGGSQTTRDRDVTLDLNYTDALSGVSQARYGDDGTWDTEPWEAPATTRNWTLTAGDGTKTVYYQLVDVVGRTSGTYSDTIVLDTTVPQVSQTTPANGSKGIDPEAPIVIQFSEPMDRGSVEAAFNLSLEGGAEVAGTFSWSADDRTLTFTPTEPLGKGKAYHVTVGPGAEDLAGNPPGAVDYTFKTAPEAEDGGLGGVVGLMAAAALAAVAAMARPRRGGPPRHRKG